MGGATGRADHRRNAGDERTTSRTPSSGSVKHYRRYKPAGSVENEGNGLLKKALGKRQQALERTLEAGREIFVIAYWLMPIA